MGAPSVRKLYFRAAYCPEHRPIVALIASIPGNFIRQFAI